MGWSLPSHIDSGLIFSFLGIWHLLSILHMYIRRPSSFRSRAWFPAPLPGRLRCAELWILLAIVLYFITIQLSHAAADIASGLIQARHLIRFQHAAFSMFYLVYIVAALINENTSVLPVPDGALQATFSLGFLMELVIFHFGHHPGTDLESHVHLLMQLILASLFLLMLLEIQFPQNPVVAIGRAACLLFKGTWFFHIGLIINYSFAIPMGCAMVEGHDFPQCPQPMDEMRAKSLQVLIFCSQAVFILILTFTAYGVIRMVVRYRLDAKGIEEMDKEEYVLKDHGGVYTLLENPQKDFDTEMDARGVPVLRLMGKSLSRRALSKTPVALPVSPAAEAGSTPVSRLASSSLPKNIKNPETEDMYRLYSSCTRIEKESACGTKHEER
ncbi:hypothetical protein R1sor_001040 [Riccia sorocarpa]|uniref:Uncharacterized protein n=1 Tax=Riccia sorocarpa TaxID=122646 RepID=A0ABD3GVQ4_9MARC